MLHEVVAVDQFLVPHSFELGALFQCLCVLLALYQAIVSDYTELSLDRVDPLGVAGEQVIKKRGSGVILVAGWLEL